MSIDEKALEAASEKAFLELGIDRNYAVEIIEAYEAAKIPEQPVQGTILPSGNNSPKNSENEQNITEREQSNGLPERNKTKPAEEQGVFRKFNVQRTDGSSEPGGKHHGCEYFVLDVGHDRHAKAALNAYVLSCQPSHPELAKDMAARYGLKPYDRIDRLAEALKEIDELKAPLRESGDVAELVDAVNAFFNVSVWAGGLQAEMELLDRAETRVKAALSKIEDGK